MQINLPRPRDEEDFDQALNDDLVRLNLGWPLRLLSIGLFALILALCTITDALSQPSVARKGDWQDQRWEGERSDSNLFVEPSQVDCMRKGEAQADLDAPARKPGTYAYYTCQIAMRVDFVKPPVIPVCTVAKPLDLTRVATCPLPLVGTFGQTRSYLPVPFPACWALADEWLPSTPAVGVCAEPLGWIKCADENARCSFTGRHAVRYGANQTFTPARNFTDGTLCANSVFGDPLPNVLKRCDVGPAVSDPPPPVVDNTIRWQPVTKGIDNSDVTISEYRVYVSQTPDSIGAVTARRVLGSTTSIGLGSLASGQWYVGVVAVAQGGEVSALSGLVTFTR